MKNGLKSCKNFFRIQNETISEEIEMEKIKQKNRERINNLDKKYNTIVSVIYNELNKRNINYNETDNQEFNTKVDEIIETILGSNIFKRFKGDNPIDIRNALKRRLNADKNKSKEGPEL